VHNKQVPKFLPPLEIKKNPLKFSNSEGPIFQGGHFSRGGVFTGGRVLSEGGHFSGGKHRPPVKDCLLCKKTSLNYIGTFYSWTASKSHLSHSHTEKNSNECALSV
jgi:hypothetical protein